MPSRSWSASDQCPIVKSRSMPKVCLGNEVSMSVTLLRQMRAASRLSVQDIAVAAKLHYNTVARVFAGEHVSDETEAAVANALTRALEDQRRKADELLSKATAA